MKKYKLSTLIPARNEMWMNHTVNDILKHIEEDTEVIVGLDGCWPPDPIKQHPRVTVVYYPKSIGQRAITNRCCSLSNAKYVMKVDAHCAFDQGFDRKLIEDMDDNWTVVPAMKNLHVFDWVCKKCGERKYQGPTPTECWGKDCDSKDFEKDIKWFSKPSPYSTSYRVNNSLEFKYWGEYKKKQKGDIVDSMSLQGSCFMCTREKYWELNLCDENWGSWGGQGAEIALKTWLSGGEVKVNKKTWYGHLFRTQGGDFGFPYSNPGNEQKKAKDTLRRTFLNDKWPLAVHKLQWLLDKFGPVPDWPDNNPSKGIIFYTDNQLNLKIAHKVQKNLRKMGLPIVSSSLKPMNFGTNVRLKEKRGHLTMFKQILVALEASTSDIVFFCEHDVLYHPSHFDFIPRDKEKFYYNVNVWKTDGEKAVKTDVCKQTSGICCYRDLAIKHYKKRVAYVEKNGFSRKMGFEPGTHGRVPELIEKSDTWSSEYPNVDIRHDKNLTSTRWSPTQFRSQKYTKGWTETTNISGWGDIKEII